MVPGQEVNGYRHSTLTQQPWDPHGRSLLLARYRGPQPPTHQYVAYSRHSVSGVASVSARLISEHKYFANASASRIVKFLAAAWKTVSRVSIRPRNHSSAAIVINNLANLSWMEVSEIVNFACSHNAGSAPRLSGWKKIFTDGWDPRSIVSSLSAAPAISLSVGSSGASGIGGHQASSAAVSASVSASVVSRSSSDEGSSTVSPAPSGPARLLARGCSWSSWACSRWVDEHRNSGCPVSQRAFCPEGLGGRKPWCLVEQAQGIRYGKHTARGASGIHPQHNHTGIPDQWSTGRTR